MLEANRFFHEAATIQRRTNEMTLATSVGQTTGQPWPHEEYALHAPPPQRSGLLPRYYGVLLRPRTYANLIYLLAGLPLGTAWFVFLVTGISVGAGLLITLVGAPLLVAVVYSWRLFARLDAALTNVLLGTRAATRYYGERGQLLTWRGLGSRLSNGRTWGALAFLFIRFPQGIASFVVAVTIPSVVAALLMAPFLPGRWVEADVNGWDADRWWIRVLIGAGTVLLAPAGFHFMNGFAWVSGKTTELLLGQSRPVAVTFLPEGTAAIVGEEAAFIAVASLPEAPRPPVAIAALEGGAQESSPPAATMAPERLAVDIVMRQVTVGGRSVELTPKEFDLFVLLVQNPHRPFSRDELLERIWRNEYDVTDRTIDTHVLRLRKKLGEAADAIRTVWGIGYKFDPGQEKKAPPL